jgi:hypothetical protein
MAGLDGIDQVSEPYQRLCRARRWVCAIPSVDYFRRQSDICLRLSLIASDDEVSGRLIVMAQGYRAKADAIQSSAPSSSI